LMIEEIFHGHVSEVTIHPFKNNILNDSLKLLFWLKVDYLHHVPA